MKTRAADPTPRVRSAQSVVPSAQYASKQWSAARISTAGATGVPFRPAQPAVVDRARAAAAVTKTNIMPNLCRTGRARRASYHTVNRPNAVRSKWPTTPIPCYRCRRWRSHQNTMPTRRRPLVYPKKEQDEAHEPECSHVC